tara:strand:- start:24 stop:482 length:459 start_codon:yes stop_codon:yes gene_type:complete
MSQHKNKFSPESICTAKSINHVCIAVGNIVESLKLYVKLFGIPLPKIETISDQKVKATMIKLGNSSLEFIEPIDNDSGVAKFIRNKGEGIHHICFEVENIQKSIKQLQNAEVKLIDTQPRQGLEGMIAFIHPKSTGNVLVELIETSSPEKEG